MTHTLLPPGATEDVVAKSVLVLAPHFDDEVLGCGGLISGLAEAGAVVRVLFLSDSGGGMEEVEDRAAYADRRRNEAREAVRHLGLSGFDELGLPDGALDQNLEPLAQGVRRALLTQRPDLLLVTSPLEVSADHRAAFRAVHDVLGAWRQEADGGQAGEDFFADLQIFAYEVNQPQYPDLLVDVSAQVPRIERAMAAYASQQERHDYLAARLGLLRFRALSLPPGPEAVEAYRRLTWTDFATRGPSALVSHLGGQPELLRVESGPQISVIVRTKDRPELLAEALQSLANSTYRRVEVVVVNDGGQSPELPREYPLEWRLVDLDTNRGRAAAANAGVEAAAGEYIAFLDDDDLVEPEHLEILAHLVSAAGVRVAYTDAAVGVYALDGESGWSCIERRLPYSRDFDPELLLVDNYIPFNTLLIERALFADAGPFDEAFESFEDWDFLIRLAARTPFQHLARVTCEYRHFRGAGHHILGDRPRQRQDFLVNKARVLAKHAGRQNPELLARVVDGLRSESVAHAEASARWRAESRQRETEFHRLNGEHRSLKSYSEILEVSRQRAESDAADLRQRAQEQDLELRRLYERERTLESDLAKLYAENDRQGADLQRLYDRERDLLGQLESRASELERLFGEEKSLNDHLGRTYAEIERLNGLIEDMKQTRGWRLQAWWETLRR